MYDALPRLKQAEKRRKAFHKSTIDTLLLIVVMIAIGGTI